MLEKNMNDFFSFSVNEKVFKTVIVTQSCHPIFQFV